VAGVVAAPDPASARRGAGLRRERASGRVVVQPHQRLIAGFFHAACRPGGRRAIERACREGRMARGIIASLDSGRVLSFNFPGFDFFQSFGWCTMLMILAAPGGNGQY